MSVQDYLQELLRTASHYELTEGEKNLIHTNGIEAFVLARLLSKKFRKWKSDSACIDRTRQAIAQRVARHEPIPVVYFQGGYKLWRLPSSPEADWAEFFNIAYVLQYVAPIAAAYEKGVDVVYYMHTLLMEKHDNLTTEEITAYGRSFQKLIDAFATYLPSNITLRILRDADIYDRKSYFESLEVGRKIAERTFSSWPEEKVHNYTKMAKLNIKWKGKEDWSVLSEKDKDAKIRLALLYEEAAISSLPKVMEVVKSPANVLVFTKPTLSMIGIGSTYTSVAKHWVGFGVLEKDGERYYPRILSPSQYDKAKVMDTESVSVLGFIPLRHCQEILLFSQRLQF